MNNLTILNDAPYGSERSYNGLRLALALGKSEGVEQRIFLMADATTCALGGQKPPEGYYSIERMLARLLSREVIVGACGTCMDARGLSEAMLMDGAHRSSMAELTEWTLWADKVITW
jgi:uncharacterized protein involved in oxidation of intracellular sulfur